MRTRGGRYTVFATFALTALFSSGCVDEKIVFRDRELFEDPPGAALSFLGYTDASTKLTVCGNCHVEKQGDWEETHHADAWNTLQANSHAQPFCEGCHTVSELGNTITETGGHNAVPDERYYDVQCEACHGPGLEHVTNPTDATVPLAPIAVGTELTYGCGECHSGSHHDFVDQWSQSRHGEGAHRPQYRNRDGCKSCHGAKGALDAFGVNTIYLEQDDETAELGIVCAVCHDPHGGPNEHQLRFPIDVQDVDQNLCMKCHQRRAIPDEASSRGPHSPQGPLLLGEIGTVGWTPPNFTYNVDRIRGTHGTDANPRLCAGCHVNAFEVTDPETGAHVYSVTGHLFKPIPCLGEDGVPTGDDSCAMTVEDRYWGSCTQSGCHGSADVALSLLTDRQAQIEGLVEELSALLDQVPASEFDTSDGVYTTAEGARFNAGLGGIESSAIHNFTLTRALLDASIDQVEKDYGLTRPSKDEASGGPGR